MSTIGWSLVTGTSVAAGVSATAQVAVSGGRVIEILLVTLIGIVVAVGSFLGKVTIDVKTDVAVLKENVSAAQAVTSKVESHHSGLVALNTEHQGLAKEVLRLRNWRHDEISPLLVKHGALLHDHAHGLSEVRESLADLKPRVERIEQGGGFA